MILGIDTSCYTTSIAVVEPSGKIIRDERRVLQVPEGQRGLQQSQALFQHLHNLPDIMETLFREIDPEGIRTVAVSNQPRPVAGSYLPVFIAGSSLARSLSTAWRRPLLETTHQEGHLMAGIFSSKAILEGSFLAVHLSGGTTELLRVRRCDDRRGFAIEILGGTGDLHAGQFVDRVGVALGLPFPAGPALEELAQQSTAPVQLPVAVQGYQFSFSGPESAAQRLIAAGCPAADVARGVEICLVNTLEKVLRRAIKEYRQTDVLVVGGVAANSYIRNVLPAKLAFDANFHFAAPGLSSDNAVGVALLGAV